MFPDVEVIAHWKDLLSEVVRFFEILKNRLHFIFSREVCDIPAGFQCGDELNSLPWFFHTNNSESVEDNKIG